MRIGSETGSLMNHLMAGGRIEPAVGMGATILCWTDRHAATIVRVTRCQVHVQYDNAKRTDENGMSECQTYAYTPNPNGAVVVFRKTKRGWRSRCGNGLLVGERCHYHDFSF